MAFAVLPAFFGVLLPARADGDVLALVGGILLTAPAAGLLAPGVVALRQREPAARQKVLLIGPRDLLAQHPVPSAHREAVLALAGAGGATMR